MTNLVYSLVEFSIVSFFANKTPREEHLSDSSTDGEMPPTSSDHSDTESDASQSFGQRVQILKQEQEVPRKLYSSV